MQEIQVTLPQLLTMRRALNAPVFASEEIGGSDYPSQGQATLFVQASNAILMCAKVLTPSAEWDSIKNFVNKPVALYDKRITTHDLGDPTTWPLVDEVPDSKYVVTPSAGLALNITFVQVRFPLDAKIPPDSTLYFRVFLNIGGNLVCVMSLEYTNLYELIKKANSMETRPPISAISPLGTVDLQFTYCDPNTLEGAPIVLRSSLGERIEIGISSNEPISNVNGGRLLDKCWAVVHGKQCVDF